MTDRDLGYRGPIRAVIFDYAGVLVDGPQDLSHRYERDDGTGVKAPVVAFDEALRTHGVELPWERIREPMGLHKRDHLRELLETAEVREQFRDEHGRDWTDDDLETIYGAFQERLLEAIVRDELARPVDGATAVVDDLQRAGKLVGNTTGYTEAAAEALTARLEADHDLVLDYHTHSDAVKAGRPAPWMIQRVTNELGVYPPAAVVKVGDTTADVAAATNAGVWSVGIYETGNDGFAALRDAGADFLVPSVRGVPDLVREIENRLARDGA